MKKFMMVSVGLFMCGLQAQSPFADAEFYLRGPVDRDGDGFLSRSSGEYQDVFHPGSPDDPRNAARSLAYESNMRALTIRNETFTDPYTKYVYQNIPCLWMTGAPTVGEDGLTYFQPARVELPSASFNYSYDRDFSFFLYLRHDGVPSTTAEDGTVKKSDYNRILCLGNRLTFGYRRFRGNYPCYWFSFGGNDVSKEIVQDVGINVWIGVVGVMDASEKKLRFYHYHKGRLDTMEIGYPEAAFSLTSETKATATLGSENSVAPKLPSDSMQTFLGSIAAVAVWGRAFSEDQALEVLRGYAPSYWRFGEKDGTADEFAGTDDAAVCTNGQGWASLPHEVTASGKPFTFAFPLDPIQTVTPTNPAPTLAAIVTMAADSGAGVLRPVLNGQALSDIPVSAGRVKPIILESAFLCDGENVLELRHVSGGSLKIDSVEGGLNGWNVGFENGAHGEFGAERSDVFTLGTENWKIFPRCLTGPGHTAVPINFCADIPDTLFNRCRYLLEFKMKHEGVKGPVENAVARVDAAGNVLEVLETFSLSGWETVTVRIPRSRLVQGKNYFRIYRYDGVDRGSNDYDIIDYLRFYPMEAHPAMTIILR